MAWIVLLASALAVWGLLRLIPLLEQRLLDQPNPRSAHCRPTPRGGGVAFVLVAAAVSGFALLDQATSPLAPPPSGPALSHGWSSR